MKPGDDVLVVAGAPIEGAEGAIGRYCGIGGEVWAYAYFDALPAPPGPGFARADVTAAAALHAGLSKADLEWFVRRAGDLAAVLGTLPDGPGLEAVDEPVLEGLAAVQELVDEGGATLSLISKVLHRRRPRLVPIYERATARRYADAPGRSNWQRLILGLRADLLDRGNAAALEGIQGRLAVALDGGVVPSRLRLLDIAIWMEATRS